jgi:hypothetical protein
VEWVTKTEIDNLGFNLYRSSNNGPLVQLNEKLIPGLLSSVSGQKYTYTDTGVPKGTPVCYTLEDIDLSGKRTSHGPACVYWPAAEATQVKVESETGQDRGQETATGTEETTTGISTTAGGGMGGVTQSAGGSGSSTRDPGPWTLDPTRDPVPSPQSPVTTSRVTAVTLRSLSAQTDGKSVLITWKTAEEVNNLGFNVYREEHGRLIRLTKDLIAGSALKLGGAQVSAGHTYSFIDARVTGHGSWVTYYLEDIDLNGTRTMYGPVTPTPSETPLLAKRPAFLREIKGNEGAAEAALKARIGDAAKRGRSSSGRKTQPLPYELMSPAEIQRVLAGSANVKLYIRQAGWYRVSLAELASLGFDTGNTRFLQLYVDGKEQPLVVKDGAVEFYGTGLATPYTDTSVYWLMRGTRAGKRIQKAGGGHGAGTQTSFPFTVELKERSIYFAGLRNGEAENFFGSVLANEPIEKQLMVTHTAGGDALLEVTLQGVTALAHMVSISVNGETVGTLAFSGQAQGQASFTVPEAVLREQSTSVTLQAAGELDISMLDTVRLTYWRTYTAENDTLHFTATGGKAVTIRGFTSNQIRVMDITDPKMVQEVIGEVRADGAGYAIRVDIPGVRERTLIAVTESACLHPAAGVPNEPSSWYARGQTSS